MIIVNDNYIWYLQNRFSLFIFQILFDKCAHMFLSVVDGGWRRQVWLLRVQDLLRQDETRGQPAGILEFYDNGSIVMLGFLCFSWICV